MYIFAADKNRGVRRGFETKNVAHAQYISANSDKQELGSLDVLFNHLIHTVFINKRYFDFGTSNVNNGLNINKCIVSNLFYDSETSFLICSFK